MDDKVTYFDSVLGELRSLITNVLREVNTYIQMRQPESALVAAQTLQILLQTYFEVVRLIGEMSAEEER